MIARLFAAFLLMTGPLMVTGCGSDVDASSGLAAFKACGGFLTGTWQVVDSEIDATAALAAANATLPAVCEGTFQSVTVEASGATIAYVQSTANTPGVALYSRTAMGGISATERLSVSAACAVDQFASTDCSVVAAALRAKGAATCNAGMAPCSCTLTVVDAADAPDTVTAQGVQFTTEEGEIWEYCQDGDKLEQAKRNSSGKLDGWLKLERR